MMQQDGGSPLQAALRCADVRRMPNVSARMVELLQQFCEQHLQGK